MEVNDFQALVPTNKHPSDCVYIYPIDFSPEGTKILSLPQGFLYASRPHKRQQGSTKVKCLNTRTQLTFAAAAAAAKFKYPHRLARMQCGGRARQPFTAGGLPSHRRRKYPALSACLTFPPVKVVFVLRPCVLTCPDATRTTAGTVAPRAPHVPPNYPAPSAAYRCRWYCGYQRSDKVINEFEAYKRVWWVTKQRVLKTIQTSMEIAVYLQDIVPFASLLPISWSVR